ncbi:MAG: presenilin family intramembrane aspartyl protease, partial [Nanoarchaeota archaeon]
FFIVVIIALGIAFNSFIPNNLKFSFYIVLGFSILLAFFKTYKKNFLIHNFTELFIYPGIAAVFIPIINIYTIIILLILISIYDIWAVWHSRIMQKMAKYQINEVGVFGGFFVPYASKQVKAKIKKLKKKLTKKQLKKKGIKINVAILGGGDVVFPIITSGVVLKTIGLIPAIFVIFGGLLGLSYLLILSKKKEFYPAMPFITIGLFLGIILGYLWVLI